MNEYTRMQKIAKCPMCSQKRTWESSLDITEDILKQEFKCLNCHIRFTILFYPQDDYQMSKPTLIKHVPNIRTPRYAGRIPKHIVFSGDKDNE